MVEMTSRNTNDDADFSLELDLAAQFGGHSAIDLISLLTKAQYEHLYASRYLAGQSFADADYAKARAHLDTALLHLYKAKWLIGGVTGAFNGIHLSSNRDADAADGVTAANTAIDIQIAVRQALADGYGLDDISVPQPSISRDGTECVRVDGFIVPPSIAPIIVVSGSSYNMGYQYAQQVVEIFGALVFERFASLHFTPERLEILRAFEAQLAEHTPEILDLCRGWSAGACASGVDMAYDAVLHLWTSAEAPPQSLDDLNWPFLGSDKLLAAMYFGQQAYLNSVQKGAAVEQSPLEHCSGFCAWGSATVDGKLKASCSTDHDCWLQATIIAYPEDGNAFIYTPFSVTGGWIPGLGLSYMAGHPGMNNRGLAYVHHGGEMHCMEPSDTWGYGVPRGASIFHALRYKGSVEEVKSFFSGLPIGNIGTCMGGPGGQWADHDHGVAFESRYCDEDHPEGLLRLGTFDAEGRAYDVLYTGNSALHADAPDANHGHAPGTLDYDVERGWHTYDVSSFAHPSLMVAALRMTAGAGGAERNRAFYRHAIPASGTIDADWAQALYRTPTHIYPAAQDTPATIAKSLKGEAKLSSCPANRGNAFTAIMEPDDGTNGLYSGCIGPLSYDLPPGGSTHGYFYYDETNCPWTVRLAATAVETVKDAKQRALADKKRAAQVLQTFDGSADAMRALQRFFDLGTSALAVGDSALDGYHPKDVDAGANAALGRAIRNYTKAQVRFRQVNDALSPPTGLSATFEIAP